MKKFSVLAIIVSIMFFSPQLFAEEASFSKRFKDTVVSDYKSFYSGENLLWLSAGFGVGGIIANSDMDENFQSWVQREHVDEDTEDFSEIAKEFGEGQKLIPLYLGLAGLGEIGKDTVFDNVVTDWGQRSLRAMFTGGPAMLAMQAITGASRPSDPDQESDWDPADDNNGVSGHSFNGAIPFLTASQMTDNIFLKSLYYTGSFLAGYSRVHDDQHYLSQALLGWWMAYCTVRSVNNPEEKKVVILPFPVEDGGGVMVTFKW